MLLRSRRKNSYRLSTESIFWTLILFSSLKVKYLAGLCCLLFITSIIFWVPNAPFLRRSSVQGGWFSHYLRVQTWSEKEKIGPRPPTSCRHLSRTSCGLRVRPRSSIKEHQSSAETEHPYEGVTRTGRPCQSSITGAAFAGPRTLPGPNYTQPSPVASPTSPLRRRPTLFSFAADAGQRNRRFLSPSIRED